MLAIVVAGIAGVAKGVIQCGCSACVLETMLNQLWKKPSAAPDELAVGAAAFWARKAGLKQIAKNIASKVKVRGIA